MSAPTFVEFYDCRLSSRNFVNPAHVTSFRAAKWDGTPAITSIELIGDAGYHTRKIYVTKTVAEVAEAFAKPDAYLYSSIEDYEKVTGYKLNQAASMAWGIARSKLSHFRDAAEILNQQNE